MKQKRRSKRALFNSVISLLICFSMLLGTTFAWFTDSETSGHNIIQTGVLDIELEYLDADDNWKPVTETTKLFDENALWEPGYTDVAYVRISNKGNLALKYQLGVNVASETGSINKAGQKFLLSNYIEFGTKSGVSVAYSTREEAREAVEGSTVPLSSGGKEIGTLIVGADPSYVALVVFMPETVKNEANHHIDVEPPKIDLGISLVATQLNAESDSFGNDYDVNAQIPVASGSLSFSTVVDASVINGENRLTEELQIGSSASAMSAKVPAGVKLEEGVSELTLEVSSIERSSNITMSSDYSSLSFDVHVSGIAEDNDVPMIINLGAVAPIELKESSITLYHVENSQPVEMNHVTELNAHNQFTYNLETGEVAISIASFSEITILVATSNPWNGEADTSWYNDTDTEFEIGTAEELFGLGKLVAKGNSFKGKTIKLTKNLDLGREDSDVVFYPIGYEYDESASSDVVMPFSGTFDGQGHTIRDLYQNTWNIKGHYDNGYYNESLGLFGWIDGGTVKNLTLYNFGFEGEFAPTGCVAGLASGGTFDNIRLINCKPYTYNTGVGGIVGWDASDKEVKYNFTDIDIDASNTVGALWGTYDAACGGIMGYLSESSYAYLTDCSIGCVLDVYNDVCGNYQYYQYRYSGMLIGTIGRDTYADISKINCDNVSVYYNDWVHYFYCEFVENSQASYTHDYQFSRVSHSELIFTDHNNNGRIDTKEEALSVTGCKHDHESHGTQEVDGETVLVEDKQAVYLPFEQMISGYGWGADHKNLDGVVVKDYDYSVTYMDGTTKLMSEYKTNESTYTIPYTAQDFPDENGNVKDFEQWVNAGGQVVKEITAGNTENITVYADWKNEYVARFVDQHGNLVAEIPFDADSGKLLENNGVAPAVPEEVGTSAGDWEDGWENKLKGAISDVTIYPVYTIDEDTLSVEGVDEDGDGKIDYYQINAVKQLGTDVTIPGYINGVPVKVVTDLSGNIAGDVKNITIQNGVETINGDAFAWTPSLKTVSIPASVTSIGSGAFADTTWSSIGSIIGYSKEVVISYDGTWEQWLGICTDGWDGGLGQGSTVICTDGTYAKTAGAWSTGKDYWKEQ